MMKLAFGQIEINGNLYFTQNWDSEISQKFTHRFNYWKAYFLDKKLNESSFFLIMIYILIHFKVFIYSPWKFMWSTDIQNALLLIYWPLHGIAITTVQLG